MSASCSRELLKACDKDYHSGLGGGKTCITNRGLHTRQYNGRKIVGYDDCLPHINGKSLNEHIGNQVSRGNRPNITDLGFGRGNFLLDLHHIYSHHVNLTGYGHIGAANQDSYDEDGAPSRPTLPLLQAKGINIVEGNITDVNTKLQLSSQDIVTMVHVWEYLHLPTTFFLSLIIDVLAPGGYLLATYCSPGSSNGLNIDRVLQEISRIEAVQTSLYTERNGFQSLNLLIRKSLA